MDLVFDNETLRRAREERGFTQKEVSERSGIPQTTISSYEKGKSVPTIKAMRCLAIAYGIKPALFIEQCFHETEVA